MSMPPDEVKKTDKRLKIWIKERKTIEREGELIIRK